MIHRIKREIVNNIKNIPGWRTNRKIVVIECDDWGGIRMPTGNVREAMISEGLIISDSRFDKYDTLANVEDLDRLYEVLSSVKDTSGNNAVMTPLVVVANPDFEKIKASDYQAYFHEPFTETLKKYYPGQDVFSKYQEGVGRGIFVPGLHGRDHISVPFWIKALKEGNRDLRKAFEYGYVSLEVPGVPDPVSGFRAEFFFSNEEQKEFLVRAIEESVTIFKSIFGFVPANFVPGNGFFHPDFDKTLVENGVKFLNVMHRTPYPGLNGKMNYIRYVSGQKGLGITFYVRNCAFEPTDEGYSNTESTMRQISAAFRWGKPAIISTHRVNFVGGNDPTNREQGLTELTRLLKGILKKWPEVEFLSSADALSSLMERGK